MPPAKLTLVRAIRRRLHWTKTELASRAGVSVRTIQNVETGERVRDITAGLIVDALNSGVRESLGRACSEEIAVPDLFDIRDCDDFGHALETEDKPSVALLFALESRDDAPLN